MKSLHGAPGYNLQTAVDTDSHMIVHHALGNEASDLRQLAPMAQASARALEAKPVVDLFVGFGRYTARAKVRAGAGAFLMSLDELPRVLTGLG